MRVTRTLVRSVLLRQEVNDKCKMKDAEVAEGKKKIHSKKNRYGNILPCECERSLRG